VVVDAHPRAQSTTAPPEDVQWLRPNREHIPLELQAPAQWVTWKREYRDGGWTKVPYNPRTGRKASTADPSTWGTCDEAFGAYLQGGYNGVGFVLHSADPYVGIDLDKCRNPATGALEVWAWEIAQSLGSFTEATPSGTGLHIIVRGKLPPGRRRKGRVEMYETRRFFTMTGALLPDLPPTIKHRRHTLPKVHATLLGKATEKSNGTVHPAGRIFLGDTDVLMRAMTAKNAPKFRQLWDGDIEGYASQSEADIALCNILAFYSGDHDQMDRLFRQCKLMRPKWDESHYEGGETYGDHTIENALGFVTERYAPPGPELEFPDELTDAQPTHPAAPPSDLPHVIETFQRWLHLDDLGPIYVTLATIVANRMEGDPLWLMLVGAPSGGKTEILNAVAGQPDVHMAATLTVGALLSGTAKRDKDKASKGGLLREIGAFGILVCKDFTSILSMNRDPRAELLAALREIYDGSWTRHVGVDGGRTLAWAGKLGLLAGCTTTIDSHHTVMATMGERFLLYRLPEIQGEEQGRRALENTGHEREMRQALASVVAGLLSTLEPPSALPPLHPGDANRLVALAALAARARSAVERDSRTREIDLIPDPEAPARLAQALRRLYGGLLVIGLDADTAWGYVAKVGLDCMPKLRRGVFRVLAADDAWHETVALALHVHYPTSTARRALEDLAVHGIAERESGGTGNADRWHLSDWARELYERASVPEMSVDSSYKSPNPVCGDFSGTLNADDAEVPW
jgi:putative DNA primase/helicase